MKPLLASAVLCLVLYAPALAQSNYRGSAPTGYTNATSNGYRSPLCKSRGTNGKGAYLGSLPENAKGIWEFGADNTHNAVGIMDFAGSNDYLYNTGGSPVQSSDFPIVMFGWISPDSVGTSALVVGFGDSDFSDLIYVWLRSADRKLTVGCNQGGAGAEAVASTGLTLGRLHRFIAVWESSTSRSIYVDVDLTGATNTTSVTPGTLDRSRMGAWYDDSYDYDGKLGQMHLFKQVPSVPNSDQRAAFLSNCVDPELIMGRTADHLWGNHGLAADARGSYDYSVFSTVIGSHYLLAARDLSGGDYHLTTVTFSEVPLCQSGSNGQGEAAFDGTDSCSVTPTVMPVTAPPFQVSVVGKSNNITSTYCLFFLGDKDVTNHEYQLQVRGASADGIGWSAQGGGAAAVAETSTTYSASTLFLAFGKESAANSRTSELDGGGTNTDTTSVTASGEDRIAVGRDMSSTPGSGLVGTVTLVILQDADSAEGQARIERLVPAYGVTVP